MKIKRTYSKRNTIRNLNEANGAFNGDRFMARAISEDIYIDEALFSSGILLTEANMDTLPKDKRGGIVTFFTDMNSTQLSANKFVNFVKQKFITVKNRLMATRYVDRLAGKFDLAGWSIAKGLHGKYQDRKTGTIFDENSISIELVGVGDDTLIKFSEELCKEFQQQAALLKSYNTDDVAFVYNPDGI